MNIAVSYMVKDVAVFQNLYQYQTMRLSLVLAIVYLNQIIKSESAMDVVIDIESQLLDPPTLVKRSPKSFLKSFQRKI